MQDPTTMTHRVIAVVCDVRGFTDFTAKVDAFNQSDHVAVEDKRRLVDAYEEVVSKTRLLAIQGILAPLSVESAEVARTMEGSYKDGARRLECAMKSTGDGLLVAVGLGEAPGEGDLRVQKLLARLLVTGLRKVVHDSGRGAFRKVTEAFLDVWAKVLGIKYEKDTTFRVAGAVALGTGLVGDEDVRDESEVRKALAGLRLTSLSLRTDAYGHGVNLAFRLCDQAGRESGADARCPAGIRGEPSPYVLVDRRVGQLLAAGSGTGRRAKEASAALAPYEFRKPMKGIEELWCFGMAEPEGAWPDD